MTESQTIRRHDAEDVDGGTYTRDVTEHADLDVTADRFKAELDRRTREVYEAAKRDTLAEVEARQAAAKRAEDERANKRNKNRLLTLFAAIVIGVVVTFLLTHQWILESAGIPAGWIDAAGPYTFVITVLFDATLTLWAFVKKY